MAVPIHPSTATPEPKQPFCCKLGKFLRSKNAPTSTTSLSSAPPAPAPAPTSKPHLTEDPLPMDDAFHNRFLSTPRRRTRYRPLNHSVSTPAMCKIHQTPSEPSTRCPSPDANITSDPVMLSWRSKSMPAELEEKKPEIAVLRSKPSVKSRWRWILRKSGKQTVAIPSLPAPPALASGTAGTTIAKEDASSRWDATFIPDPPLSAVFPTSYADLNLTPVTSLETVTPDDDDDDYDNDDFGFGESTRRRHRHDSRRHRQSVNKLARTLGVLPHDFVPKAEIARLSSSLGGKPPLSAQRPNTANQDQDQRRSLAVTTSFSTPPSLRRLPPEQDDQLIPSRRRSRASLSTVNTDDDDVHQFGLADDLSETWGKQEGSNESRSSIHSSYSPISPITFRPPTPVTTDPLRRASSAQILNRSRNSTLSTSSFSADKLKQIEDVTTSSLSSLSSASPAAVSSPTPSSSTTPRPPNSTLTLTRSRSMPLAGSRHDRPNTHSASSHYPPLAPNRRLPTPSPSSSGEVRPQTRNGEPGAATAAAAPLAALTPKANWLDMPLMDEEANARSFMARHPEYADDYRNWSGQWNQNDMQYVIRMLRALR